MTAKKDLKKSKSKKKIKKYNQYNYKKKVEEVSAPQRKGIFGNYSKNTINDKNIAILSLVESLILLALILLLIFVKPGNDFGNSVIEQNKFLIANIFGQNIRYAIVGIVVLCFVIYALGYRKNKEYKNFYASGMTFLGVQVFFILTQNNRSFYLYGYGMIIVILMTITEMLKYYYMVKYLERLGNKED